jgi:hypothetical protein
MWSFAVTNLYILFKLKAFNQKELLMKKKKSFKREDFEPEDAEEATGEFRLRRGYGKHIIGKTNKDLTIKGKRLKRVVEVGDVLVCPPSRVAAFMDKFERIDVLPEKAKPIQKQLKKQHKGGGRYDVINERTRVKLNADFLTKDEADEMIASEGVDPEEDE